MCTAVVLRFFRILRVVFILSQLLSVARAQDSQTATALRNIAAVWTGLPWPGNCPGQCLDWPYIGWSATNDTVIALYVPRSASLILITSAGGSRRRSSSPPLFLQRGRLVREEIIGCSFLTSFRRCVFVIKPGSVVRVLSHLAHALNTP